MRGLHALERATRAPRGLVVAKDAQARVRYVCVTCPFITGSLGLMRQHVKAHDAYRLVELDWADMPG